MGMIYTDPGPSSTDVISAPSAGPLDAGMLPGKTGVPTMPPGDRAGNAKPAADTTDSIWGSLKTRAGQAIGKVGEIFGDAIDIAAGASDEIVKGAKAWKGLQEVLNPDRAQRKTDTGDQGNVSFEDFLTIFGIGAASARGSSAGGTSKFSAGGAGTQPSGTNWVIPALLAGGGILGLILLTKASR
jgi:hypothetical protein